MKPGKCTGDMDGLKSDHIGIEIDIHGGSGNLHWDTKIRPYWD